VDVDEHTGNERALVIGEPTKEGIDMLSVQETNIKEQSMFTTRLGI